MGLQKYEILEIVHFYPNLHYERNLFSERFA